MTLDIYPLVRIVEVRLAEKSYSSVRLHAPFVSPPPDLLFRTKPGVESR